MHISTLVATLVAVTSTVVAHDEPGSIPGAPKIFGRKTIRDLKARGILRDSAKEEAHAHESEQISKRQIGGPDGQCGPGVGSCAAGYCCSSGGWCGLGSAYCEGPFAQFNYGSGADFFTVPPGPSTAGIARPQLGSQPYGGVGIYDCVEPNMIALTFDDGPNIYTSHILDVLDQYNVPATFFVTGNNVGKGQIDNAAYPWSELIARMYHEGHQIASHTWTHQSLGSRAYTQDQEQLTQQQRLNQMYYNEMAIRNIIGEIPTYMRPPYSDCDAQSGCEADMKNLGYNIVYFDLDTSDYLNDSPSLIQNSKNIYAGNLTDGQDDNWLVISHDIQQQTAYNLTQYMITFGQANGWKFGTVGDCLGDPKQNWYRSAPGGKIFTSTTKTVTPPPTPTPSKTSSTTGPKPTAVSTDATCGGASGFTCAGSAFGNCCSQSGWW